MTSSMKRGSLKKDLAVFDVRLVRSLVWNEGTTRDTACRTLARLPAVGNECGLWQTQGIDDEGK
jgi:hypothetical protein